MSGCSGKKGKSKSRDEVISTFSRYGLLSGERIFHLGESEEIQRLVWFLSNGRIESFELPDAYVKVDDQILIIEHFAIDGFETYPDGGSKLQRHEAMTEREFRDMPATETGVHTTTKIGVSNSYAGFIKNCQRVNHSAIWAFFLFQSAELIQVLPEPQLVLLGDNNLKPSFNSTFRRQKLIIRIIKCAFKTVINILSRKEVRRITAFGYANDRRNDPVNIGFG